MKELLHECWNIISGMNFILAIIGICSVVAFAVFFERLSYLRKVEIDGAELLVHLKEPIEEGDMTKALSICDTYKSAISNVIKAALCKCNRPREQIEGACELRGIVEIAKMEKNAKILSIIAHITPLIGLLGTVLGFIKAFGQMRLSSLVEISATQIGQAMEYALVTTAAGLVVAIPSVIAYNYIVSKIEGMVVEIQATAQEVVDLLSSKL